MRDNLIGGAVAGAIGGLAEMASGFIPIMTGLARSTTVHAAISFMAPAATRPGPLSVVLGIISHLTVAGLLGLVLFYILRFTGTDHYLLKGLGMALAVYVLFTNGLGPLFVSRGLLAPDPATQLSILGSHLVGGMVTAFIGAGFIRNRALA
jgi:hypothetical protein